MLLVFIPRFFNLSSDFSVVFLACGSNLDFECTSLLSATVVMHLFFTSSALATAFQSKINLWKKINISSSRSGPKKTISNFEAKRCVLYLRGDLMCLLTQKLSGRKKLASLSWQGTEVQISLFAASALKGSPWWREMEKQHVFAIKGQKQLVQVTMNSISLCWLYFVLYVEFVKFWDLEAGLAARFGRILKYSLSWYILILFHIWYIKRIIWVFGQPTLWFSWWVYESVFDIMWNLLKIQIYAYILECWCADMLKYWYFDMMKIRRGRWQPSSLVVRDTIYQPFIAVFHFTLWLFYTNAFGSTLW